MMTCNLFETLLLFLLIAFARIIAQNDHKEERDLMKSTEFYLFSMKSGCDSNRLRKLFQNSR